MNEMDNCRQKKVQNFEEFVDRHLKPDLEQKWIVAVLFIVSVYATESENRMREEVDLLAKVSEHFPTKINSTSSCGECNKLWQKLFQCMATGNFYMRMPKFIFA
ncbi:hypothetical protein Dsin_027725 [Dipteronia sinensis]|uniref:Uncharacterized protein n=1 Tax=Dipteronia sinensis TaxID=43782 RepID=A0AAD9ZPG0_9ROSI|nr:hypothetical protein Dsin_027725 [Dipteronia sinensis]